VQLEINLFDPSLRPSKVLLPARIFAPALGAVAVLLVTCAVLQSYEARVAAASRRDMEGRSAALQAEIRGLGEQLGARRVSPEVQARATGREALRAMREAAVVALRTRGDMANGGHARFLQALARQSVDGVWLTEVTVAGHGDDIALRGRTLDPELVADYLRRLGREEALQGVAFNQLSFQRPVAIDGPAGAPPRFIEFAVASGVGGDGAPSAAPAMTPPVPPAARPGAASPDLAALAPGASTGAEGGR
jgi:Tfp pilus assembly protein PilN